MKTGKLQCFYNKENKCRNVPVNKLTSEVEKNKSILVKEEEIKRFTHKFAREKVEYEEKINELEEGIKNISEYCESLEKDVEELQQQNRKIVTERNDLYEYLQYQKHQCKCESYQELLRKRDSEIQELQNQIKNLDQYIKNMQQSKKSAEYQTLLKSFKILQIEHQHACQSLEVEKNINSQLSEELEEIKYFMNNSEEKKVNHQNEEITALKELLQNFKLEIVEKDQKHEKDRKNWQNCTKTCNKMIFQLRKQLERAREKMVEDQQIRDLVFQYEGQILQLEDEISKLKA